jgi:hypothetical protein
MGRHESNTTDAPSSRGGNNVRMPGRNGLRRRTLVLMAGELSLLACVVTLLVAWKTKDLGTAANLGQIVGVVLALPTLAIGLFAWWWRSRQPAATSAQMVRAAAETLARLAAAQWEQEAAFRSLDDPYPIAVRWRLTAAAELMDHPPSISTSGTVVWDGTSDQISDLVMQFRDLRRRRLVILGEAGSGKTTLAVQLVRKLLATHLEGEPVAVLVSAASWDAQAQPDVWEWVAEQLTLGYPALSAPEYGPNAARNLVAGPNREVLPVLDGVDEISEAARAVVMRALNRYLGTGQLILTCRTGEYTQAVIDAADVLTGAAVIEPEDLTPQTASDYLTSCLPPLPSPSWQHLLETLRTDATTPLAEICSTPLGLWLLRATHTDPGSDPGFLTDLARYPTAASLQAHLFDQLIPALIATRPASDSPAAPFKDPAQATRWLGYLAWHLSNPPTHDGQPRTRDFAWWRLAAIAIHPVKLHRTVGIVFGLVGGFASWIALGKLGTAFMIGSASLLVGQLSTAGWAASGPGYANLGFDGRKWLLAKRIALGALVSLMLDFLILLFIVSLVALGIAKGNISQPLVVSGLFLILGAGLGIGTAGWVEAPARTGTASTPMTTWRADRLLNLLRILAAGIPFGVVVGIAIMGTNDLVSGLAVGLGFAVLSGLAAGRHHAWIVYLIATFWLAKEKLLPRRLMPFLDDAHRLGLLRAVGPVYQFRHAEFQEHLAARHLSVSSSSD